MHHQHGGGQRLHQATGPPHEHLHRPTHPLCKSSCCLCYALIHRPIDPLRNSSLYCLYWELAPSDGSENYSAHTIHLRELEKILNCCHVHILHLHLDAFIQNVQFVKYICQKIEKQYVAVGTVRMFIEPSAKH